MLDVRKMVLLREVRLRGSISAAAHSLSYSHSAVSQQLSALEKQAGVPLLEKVGRGVRLTPAAEDLVAHADEIVAILERAESNLAASDRSVRGVLRIAAFTTISRLAVPPVIARLHDEHPDLDVRYRQVEPENGLQMLSARRVDVVIADSYPGTSESVPSEFTADLLLRDPIRVYLPVSVEATSIDDLRRMRWVFEPSGSEAHAFTRRLCQQRGFDPDVAYESPDLLFHLRLVQEGLAGAFLPDLLVRDLGVRLESTPLFDVHNLRDISLFCRAGAERRPAIAACRQAFVEQFDEGS
ncbi:LysR family transcriptional regulator [Gordonia mangrovi]|uniref:LysR family transcriptional regulator n=1 Tax=Gordonia mangrovi TaxID=2665643 RepID=UPI00136E9A48|nr:LysR family transcriptional regulator [Gordonia mangrovi]UVF76645.1 LysR family transcriptional regulator [Gordonia mangrovi]